MICNRITAKPYEHRLEFMNNNKKLSDYKAAVIFNQFCYKVKLKFEMTEEFNVWGIEIYILDFDSYASLGNKSKSKNLNFL